MCRYILHAGHLPVSAGGRGHRRRASDCAKDAHTESFQHSDLGSVLFLLHSSYWICPASWETVPSAMVWLRLGDWQWVNSFTNLRMSEKPHFKEEETLRPSGCKNSSFALPPHEVELMKSWRRKYLAVETIHWIHEQAGLPLLKPLFYLADRRGPQPLLVDKSVIQIVAFFLYWLAHEERQTWTEALQVLVLVPFFFKFFYSLSLFSSEQVILVTDGTWRAWQGQTWGLFFVIVLLWK